MDLITYYIIQQYFYIYFNENNKLIYKIQKNFFQKVHKIINCNYYRK